MSFTKYSPSLNALSGTALLFASIISIGIVSAFWFNGPLWIIALLLIIGWLPLFMLKIKDLWQRSCWLTLFFILVATQGAHLFEHGVQMLQLHVLGLSIEQANGIFATLNNEWVHFLWNVWVLLLLGLLCLAFRRNRWLWPTVLFSLWHALEHSYVIAIVITTGHSSPGLLAQGGALAGGLPISRADLHFLYNLVEEGLLVLTYRYQVAELFHHTRRDHKIERDEQNSTNTSTHRCSFFDKQ